MNAMTVLDAVVMTVDPMMTVLGPMALNPDHFVVTLPITVAVAVKWPIAQFNTEARLDDSRENNARRGNRDEQQCFLNPTV